uniref:Uncharacterized protein n=1 Tax=Otus sunia TaxID=257818 RepID=A0A8C8EA90_9STRI
MLLKAGASTEGKDERGQTALSYAVSQGSENTAKVLLEAGASVDSITAERLLHHKADVNVKDKQSKSPLHFAAERGDKTMVEILLNANADPNAQDKEKKTPLHTAAVRGHLSIVKVLLAKKGRFGAKDMDGCTPMHYAAIKGNTEIVKILLTSGKNKNIDDRNIWRKTALHISAEHGHSDLINLLLKQGSKELKSTGCPEGNVLSAWFMLILVLLSDVGLLYSRFTRPHANKSYQEAWYKPTRGVPRAQNFADTMMLFSGHYYVLH